ncbi:MinD/ParA family protein [Desulfothermus naphthae]
MIYFEPKGEETSSETTKVPFVVSITSGKGGVGKTNISTNLACLLGEKGYNTLLLDADLGLGNVDVLLGITPKFNVLHLLSNEISLDKVLFKTDHNFSILPAPSGVMELVSLTPGQKLEFLDALDPLDSELDFFIVDTGAGINDNVLYFNMATQYRIIVLTPEPTSLTDSYALIKVLNQHHGVNDFFIIINMCVHEKQAKEVFKRFYLACDRFLKGVSLNFLGFIPKDNKVVEAVKLQNPFCKKFPKTKASVALNNILNKLLILKNKKKQVDGNIKFFWKKLLLQG